MSPHVHKLHRKSYVEGVDSSSCQLANFKFENKIFCIVSSDESLCLFGTPPRVARRRTLTRRVHNNRVQSIEEEAGVNGVDAILGLDEESDGMDTVSNVSCHSKAPLSRNVHADIKVENKPKQILIWPQLSDCRSAVSKISLL